ncbi:MAG: exodeoxyribonuclease III [Alphaproteobacteria bacterium]|nr:exodeoxyribonuclease III [Alphaproteobacteria bacterium]
MPALKIATWNINSVRARLDIVARLTQEEAPDILCLQETKVEDGSFPFKPLRALGYEHIVIHGQKMHHGVAILSKVPLIEEVRQNWHDAPHARHIGVRLPNGWRLENVYIPAGGDIPDSAQNPKFGEKLDFLKRMTDWSSALAEPTIILGDFNIAPLESDVWSHKQLLDVVSHTPIEVAALEALQASHNWVDLGRRFIPAPQRYYSWWSYRAKDWAASDRGRRLDHVWVSPSIAHHARAHYVVEQARGWDKASDHVPLMTTFNGP